MHFSYTDVILDTTVSMLANLVRSAHKMQSAIDPRQVALMPDLEMFNLTFHALTTRALGRLMSLMASQPIKAESSPL